MKLPAVMLINIKVIMGNLVFNITMLLKLFVVIMIQNTVILLKLLLSLWSLILRFF